jgi:L-amino acid N-acyltransferase
LVAINDIYNYYVVNSTCTYQEEPELIEDRRRWFQHHRDKHPVIVAKEGIRVVAWGSLSAYHPRSAYQRTVENSVYVHHEYRRHGLGSLLLGELIKLARKFGHYAIIAAIDGEQEGSVALHTKFGFKHVGRFKKIGYKFGRWLDVIYMELMLEETPDQGRSRTR